MRLLLSPRFDRIVHDTYSTTFFTMRLSFLALVGYLISCVACFGEYGAYERVLYWNAYQLDAALHDRPQFISTGCTNGMPKRVKKCTFQQWLDYMDNSEGTTRITADISGMSVDRLAQELQDHRYTGKYKLHHVINGVQDTSGQMPTLFKEVRADFAERSLFCRNSNSCIVFRGSDKAPELGYEYPRSQY